MVNIFKNLQITSKNFVQGSSILHYYLIKYKAKQKHFLPYYITNEKVKEVL